MLQVVQNYKSRELRLEEVPTPALKEGGVIVRSHYSLISSGTEANAVRQAAMGLVSKAKARPNDVKQVLHSVRRQGLRATHKAIMNRLDSLTPLGYSLSGTVISVGKGSDEFRKGQRVACGGAGYANHAEYNFVPKNLVVPVPDGVSMAEAACTTVGTVALQGFRQSGLSVGDTSVVIGLGLIGQIYLQIARAAGCRTIGIDINPERVKIALELGAEAACGFDPQAATAAVKNISEGIGADAVALAVGTDSNEPLELAVQLVRDRGKLVNIGKAKIDVPYEPFFKKDLSLVFSRSYGPGRYDPTYEDKGLDYPPGYVKWTERRNMMAFLDLLAKKKLNLGPIIENPVPFRKAEEAYRMLREGKVGLGILFKYPDSENVTDSRQQTVYLKTFSRRAPLVFGCIGAGNYANTKLLPVLANISNVRLKAVATLRSTSCKTAATRFGFEQATTNYHQVLEDDEINTVLIATPHSSHAELISEALRAGKAVFAEKPLAISIEQLEKIKKAIDDAGNGRLQIGFNRRFAPLSRQIKEAFGEIAGPLQIIIRINAGRLEYGRWVSDPEESGGRFVGEGCHFVDLASYFVGEDPIEVHASRVQQDLDSMCVLLRYRDGSLATIVYVTSGSTLVPKEYIEIYGGGQTAVIDDFKRAIIYTEKKRKLGLGLQNKGQKQELHAFCDAVLKGKQMPISLDSLFATTDATFKVLESLKTNRTEVVERPNIISG